MRPYRPIKPFVRPGATSGDARVSRRPHLVRNKTLLLCSAAAIALLVYAILACPRQPSYQGRNLTTWLDILFPASGGSALQKQAVEQAVREMGQESLPWLVGWLKVRNGPFAKGFGQRIYPTLLPLGVGLIWRPAIDRNVKTISAFRALGKTADPAIPQLLGIVTNATDRIQRFLVLQALCAIGSEKACDAVMSLEGTSPQFTEQYLRTLFLSVNPSMAELPSRRFKSRDGNQGMHGHTRIARVGTNNRTSVGKDFGHFRHLRCLQCLCLCPSPGKGLHEYSQSRIGFSAAPLGRCVVGFGAHRGCGGGASCR